MNATTQPKGTRALKFLRVMIIIMLALTILLGVLNFFLVGFIDFPCFVEYNAGGDCLDTGSSLYGEQGVEANTRIEAFMTTYIAGWSGGGCDYQDSQSDSLALRNSVGTLELSRQGDTLLVDGKAFEKGEAYRRSHWLDWHPWIIAKTQFTNAGVLADCQAEPAIERLVVIGSYGTQTSLLKGGLISLALAAALVYVQIRIRKA